MRLPNCDPQGYLPPGLHAASLAEVVARFGTGSLARQRQAELLRQVVDAARSYPTIKRVLVWGSFVTSKPEPNDLDYTVVVSVMHRWARIHPEHRRFFVPYDAHLHYGVDRLYLAVADYPVVPYLEILDFVCQTRARGPCGIAEISIWGEFHGYGD